MDLHFSVGNCLCFPVYVYYRTLREYYLIARARTLFLLLSVMLATVLTAMLLGMAYLVFITFKLARTFESRENGKDDQDKSEQLTGDLNLESEVSEGEAQV